MPLFTKTKTNPVTAYINSCPKEALKKMRDMRACLRKAAPGAEEGIKWGSVSYSYKRILFTFAGFKHHIGFYPTPAVIKAFKKDLAHFKSARGSVQFPLDKALPKGLITKMARMRVKESKEKDVRWM